MPEIIQVNIVENTNATISEIIDKGDKISSHVKEAKQVIAPKIVAPKTNVAVTIKNNSEVIQTIISEKGQKGNPGKSYNGDNIRTMNAGEVISSGMAVIIRGEKVYKFDVNNEELYGHQVGIAVTASSNADEDINIQLDGIVHIPGLGLEPDTLYYIGNNSLPTIFTINMKLVVVIGVAISSDKLKLNFLTQVITE